EEAVDGTLIIFWVFAGLAVVSALGCITRRSPVASALWLVVTLFSLAALFVLLDAQFIAVLQVLVYAGAIMVLFLFVIMLLNLGRPGPTDLKGPAGLGMGVLLAGLLLVQLLGLRRVAPPLGMALAPGVAGVLLRRNAIVIFMCVELMLKAVNLTFVALAQQLGVAGQIFVFFVMAVAAAEAGVGLAIMLAIYRHRQTVNLQNINLLKG